MSNELTDETCALSNAMTDEFRAFRKELRSHTRWIIGTVLLVDSVSFGLIALLIKGG